MSLAAVSKHVMTLERAGLVRREVVGREHHCHLAPRPLGEAADWLEGYRLFREERLDALEAHVLKRRRARAGRRK